MDNTNIKAKKSLGQNFLKSKKALSDMLIAGEVGENDIVLEAGPGKGALTEELLKKAGRVIAVEKDDSLIEFLRDKFKSEISGGKLELVHGDILQNQISNLKSKKFNYKLIANIPYYITGQFLRKFLSGENQPSKMVILLQKEVVKRIMANDGKESILSLSVKTYGKPKNIGKVSKENFSPKPKVDSAILLIDNISRDFFKTTEDEENFFKIIKAGFAHKRKLLARNIENCVSSSFCHSRPTSSRRVDSGGNSDSIPERPDPRFHGDDRTEIQNNLAKSREYIEKIFETCRIPPKARAEDVKIEQWKCLSEML